MILMNHMCIHQIKQYKLSQQHKYISFYPIFIYTFSILLLTLIIHTIIPTATYAQEKEQTYNLEAIDKYKAFPNITLNRVVPSLDWFLDPSGQITIEQVLSPAIQRSFSSFLFTKLPKQEGTFWFRFTIDSTTRLKLPELILDLNKRVPGQFPGKPKVWISSMGSEKSKPLEVLNENIFPIKYSGSEIIDVYIQMPGAPGFGFKPILLSSQYFLNIYTFATKAIYFLLLTTAIVCIARGIIEKQEWRIWSTLYIGAIFINILWGLPQTPKGALTILDMPGLLAPGIALFALAHIGRCLMQTRHISSILDTQLVVSALPGIVLSIIPLFPGYLWTLPFLSIWPLIAIILLPTTIFAVTQKIKKSKTVLLIYILLLLSLLPLAIPIAIIPQILSPEIINILSLLFLSSSCTVLALTTNPKPLFTSVRKRFSQYNKKMLTTFQSEQTANNTFKNEDTSDLEKLEQKLQLSLNRILKELANLNTSFRSTSLKQHIENIENTAEYLNHVINDAPELLISKTHPEEEIFDLTQLMLTIHNAIEQEAEAKNLALSWFIAPHLSKQYRGNRLQLTQSLYLLTENAVQSTSKGLLQLRVQRVAESTNPGHLLFTISVIGKSMPQINRNSLALIHVWELVHTTGGTLSITSGPKETTISFSTQLVALQTEFISQASQTQHISSNQIQRIIIADNLSQQRQLLTYYLDDLPYEIIESKNSNDIYETYKNTLSSLLILGPDIPDNDIIETIGQIRVFEGEHNFPPIPILALCKLDVQAENLIRIGCTHTLLEPISRKELRRLVLRLVPVSQRVQSIFNITEKTSSQNNTTIFPHVASTLYTTNHHYTTSKNINDGTTQDLDEKTVQHMLLHDFQQTSDIEPLQSSLENSATHREKKQSPSIKYPPLEEPSIHIKNKAEHLYTEKQEKDHQQKTKGNLVTNKEKIPKKSTLQKNKTSLPLLDIIDITVQNSEEASINQTNFLEKTPVSSTIQEDKRTTTQKEESLDKTMLNMENLFSSTLKFIKGQNISEEHKELFSELNLTLHLLQHALSSKQSENLTVFPQVIINLAEQLQLSTIVNISKRIIDAINAQEHTLIEELVSDMTIALEENKSSFML